ncbi:MAG: sulfatase-like hydrolase/transferase [Flavobacteriales bacterium]|jgi:arylsulfatase A-like enzyme|nr:sulfatase-like hydrolase/transferase [Flavobacteriales bacterium]
MRIKLGLVAMMFVHLVSTAQQPNILLVIADDVGLDPVPGYLPGPLKATMPNLSALMAQGLSFDNVWASPLCSPTRSTIITGRYGYQTGVLNPGELSLLPADEITLHRYLTDNGSGYASCIIGKWHLGGSTPDPAYPNVMGVPHYAGLLSGAVNNYSTWPLTINGSTSPCTEYITTKITDMAIDWINQQTAPWFCWVAYNAPHTPYHLPPLSMHSQGALPADQASINANPLPYYLAMLESVDHELGRLLAALTPAELANTVVLFIGDNGTEVDVIQAPYLQNHAKGTLYEGGVRVPFVMAGPGVTRAGEREDALVSSVDLFATIVELTGVALPAYEQSRSLVPLLTQSGQSVRSCLYTDVSITGSSGSAIRDARWKLINFDNGQQRFYDLLNDPWEEANLLLGGLTQAEQIAFDALNNACDLSTSVPAQQAGTSFSIRPNPVSDVLLVDAPSDAPVDVLIRDALGRVVLQQSATRRLELVGLKRGIYAVELEQRERREVIRMVKE